MSKTDKKEEVHQTPSESTAPSYDRAGMLLSSTTNAMIEHDGVDLPEKLEP